MAAETIVELSISSLALTNVFADNDASVGVLFGHRRMIELSRISDASYNTCTIHDIITATLAVPLDQDMSKTLQSKNFSPDFVPVGLFRVTRGAQAHSMTVRDRFLIGQFVAAVKSLGLERELFVFVKCRRSTLEGLVRKSVSALVFDLAGRRKFQKVVVPNLGMKSGVFCPLSDFLVEDAANAILDGMKTSLVLDMRSVEDGHRRMLNALEDEIAQLEVAEEKLRSMKGVAVSHVQASTKKSFAKLSKEDDDEMNAWINGDSLSMTSCHLRNSNYVRH